jgi:protein ImuB
MECALFHEAAAATRFEISLFRPSGSLRHLLGLLRTRLERMPIPDLVWGMSLRVTSAEPLVDVQAEYVETERTEASRELAGLIDRLSSRLGREAVTRPTLIPDPQPEFACRFEPVIQEAGGRRQGAGDRGQKRGRSKVCLAAIPKGCVAASNGTRRPLTLWPRPARVDVLCIVPGGAPSWFRWQGRDFRVTRAWGPERIDTGWWRGNDVQRDYYMVATETGTRFWLFHRRDDSCWLLHGCFD